MVKPSDSRWLSHERCVRAILKELPCLIITLQQLYEESGDAEAYGLALLLTSYPGVATIVLLSALLDLLAKLNCFMQRKAADFSKLPIILRSIVDEIKHLKDPGSEWCSIVESTVEMLETEHSISVKNTSSTSRNAVCANTMAEFRDTVAIPYIDLLISNINSRFSEGVVKLLVCSSFNPASIPTEEMALTEYGKEELKVLVDFYGKEATVEFEGTTYTSLPVVDTEEVMGKWTVFKRAFAKEKKAFMEKNKLTKPPTLQHVKTEMESTSAYTDIFPEIFKLMNLSLALPVGTASVERSFSKMKLIKTRLCNRISDSTLPKLMRIAIRN